MKQKEVRGACEKLGWPLVDQTDNHVLVSRGFNKYLGFNTFATLEYGKHSNGLFWGHYDMTILEAATDLKARADRSKGYSYD